MTEREEVPRRSEMTRWCPAERAIFEAMQVVESMPADVRLTDAVVLLGDARSRVADYIDGIAPAPSPAPPASPERPREDETAEWSSEIVQAIKDWEPLVHGSAIGIGNALNLDANGVEHVRRALLHARINGYCRAVTAPPQPQGVREQLVAISDAWRIEIRQHRSLERHIPGRGHHEVAEVMAKCADQLDAALRAAPATPERATPEAERTAKAGPNDQQERTRVLAASAVL